LISVLIVNDEKGFYVDAIHEPIVDEKYLAKFRK
jgi:hypothetical protein